VRFGVAAKPDPERGVVAKGAKSSTGDLLSISASKRAVLLTPQRVSPGHSARAARMDKELHARNPMKLNHALAYHIDRAKDWQELVSLLFDHMHHLSSHNWVRGSQKLVALSPTRQLLDVDSYERFGRLVVRLEMELPDLDAKGLMKVIFVPYHYLRQCLKHMRLAQEAALARHKADPEAAKRRRAALRQQNLAQQENLAEFRAVEQRVAATQQALKDKHAVASGADATGTANAERKGKKLRAIERRAGRTFVSVADTLKRRGSSGSAFKATGPKRNKRRPKQD
jgi:hypothetical protein